MNITIFLLINKTVKVKHDLIESQYLFYNKHNLLYEIDIENQKEMMNVYLFISFLNNDYKTEGVCKPNSSILCMGIVKT